MLHAGVVVTASLPQARPASTSSRLHLRRSAPCLGCEIVEFRLVRKWMGETAAFSWQSEGKRVVASLMVPAT